MSAALTRTSVRRAVARHRRLLAAGLGAGAVAAALTAVAPAPPDTVGVLTAARDLAAGTALAPADLVVAALPAALVPAGALTDVAAVAGRLAAGPVRQGEPLTDVPPARRRPAAARRRRGRAGPPGRPGDRRAGAGR